MEFADTVTRYSVVISGKEENLEQLNLTDLGAHIDLNGLGAGSHTLDVKFNLPASVMLKNRIRVKVIMRAQDGGEVPSLSHTPAPTAEAAVPE